MSWVRCARVGGDGWGPGEPPIGAAAEAYRLDILDGSTLKRTVTTASPAYVYDAAQQAADFGGAPSVLTIRVAQLGENGEPGLNSALTITL